MNKPIIKLTGYFLWVALICTGFTAGASSVLEKKITYKAENVSLKNVLNEIGSQNNIRFSYSESLVPVNKTVSVNAQQKPLSGVLDALLDKTITYKEINGQVVLTKARNLAVVPVPPGNFTISGYVTESGSQEPLIGVNIFIPGTSTGTVTNTFGFYSLTIPGGDLKLTYSYIGFSPQNVNFILAKDTTINIALAGALEVAEVEVTAIAVPRESQRTQMSTIDIPVEQIKEIPALFGEKDVLKVVQLMPGVQKGSEGQSGFYVRGGGPDQNLVILDGAPVYNAFHLFGFFSVFNGDALKSVELTKGGFPARYGGRLSSVLDMHMKEGNREKITGEAGIGLIASRLLLEGPIKKNKSSFLVSGRRTYVDLLMQPFMPTEAKFGYYFYDFNAKVNYDFSKKDKVYLSGYFGRDQFYVKTNDFLSNTKFRIGWGNATATARWNHLFNNKLFGNASFIFSNYRFQISATEKSRISNDEYNLRFYSQIQDFSLKYDLDYFPISGHHVRMGALSTWHRFSPSAVVYKDTYVGEEFKKKNFIDGFENALYIEDDMKLGNRFRVNAGVRLTHFANRNKHYVFPEPRLAGAYQLKNDVAIKASVAVMNQFMHMLTNTGIGLPTDLWVPATRNIPPQRSVQGAVGIVKDFVKHNFTASIEGYYKKMDRIIGYREGATFVIFDDPTSTDNYSWEENITSGQGWSYGTEFLLQRKKGRFNGWIGYTLSWTQLQFDAVNFGRKFWAKYDRRHDVSVVGMYKLTDLVSVSATWVYGTGQAITLPLATYTGVLNGSPGSSQTNVNTPTLAQYGDRNSFRMGSYHRMDVAVRFTKKKKWGERIIELGVYNLYNRANPYFYYASNNGRETRLKQVSLFPIIPSITVNYKF